MPLNNIKIVRYLFLLNAKNSIKYWRREKIIEKCSFSFPLAMFQEVFQPVADLENFSGGGGPEKQYASQRH